MIISKVFVIGAALIVLHGVRDNGSILRGLHPGAVIHMNISNDVTVVGLLGSTIRLSNKLACLVDLMSF